MKYERERRFADDLVGELTFLRSKLDGKDVEARSEADRTDLITERRRRMLMFLDLAKRLRTLPDPKRRDWMRHLCEQLRDAFSSARREVRGSRKVGRGRAEVEAPGRSCRAGGEGRAGAHASSDAASCIP